MGGAGGARLSGPDAAAADHREAVALCERPEGCKERAEGCKERPEGCKVRPEAEAMARANLARALCAQATHT